MGCAPALIQKIKPHRVASCEILELKNNFFLGNVITLKLSLQFQFEKHLAETNGLHSHYTVSCLNYPLDFNDISSDGVQPNDNA